MIRITFTELLICIASVVGLVALLQFHWKRRRMYRLAGNIKGPLCLPFIGNAHLFTGSTFDILDSTNKLMDHYGSPLKIWLGHRLFFGIAKPEYLEIILNSPKALGKDDLYKFTSGFVGEGIFSASVAKWKKNRKLIAPTFNQKILNTFCDVFAEQSNILVECLRKVAGRDIDILHYLENCTLDVVCETSMGIKINAQNSNAEFGHWVGKILTIAFQRMFQIWYHTDFIFNKFPIGKEFQRTLKKFHSFTDNVIRSKKNAYFKLQQFRKEYPEAEIEDKKKMKTFLDLLLELAEDGFQLTDKELRDEVNTFLVAGTDTTASTLGFIFVMLGMHCEFQQKVYDEVLEVLGNETSVEHSDLPKLKYMERFIKEVMRLFPIGPLVVRANEDDIDLGEHVLPAGSSSVLIIINTHRNPLYWPDPLKFDPDRFLPEEVAKRHPFAYLPFTGGPRICIGMKYGMMMLKTIIAHTVRSFIISTPYKTVPDVKIKQDLVLKTVYGHNVRLDVRT